MGLELHYEAVVEHPELGKIVWGLWEYPVGIENYQKTDAGPPDDPFTVFLNSYHGSSHLLAESGSSDGGHLVNRLVFSHQVTALEADLGDTLKNESCATVWRCNGSSTTTLT